MQVHHTPSQPQLLSRVIPLAERFRRQIHITEGPDGCWIWTGHTCTRGYGEIKVNGRDRLAHRVSYEMYKGEIPASLEVHHSCNNPACVNPAHLFAVTHEANMRYEVAMGRVGKLTIAQVEHLRRLRTDGTSARALSRIFGISEPQVYAIVAGHHWR